MNAEQEFTVLLNKVFEYLWEKTDTLIKQVNPCQHSIVKGCHSCVGKRLGDGCTFEIYRDKNSPQTGCCSGCEYLDKIKGCTAEKPLKCRVWLCGTVQRNFADLNRKLEEIENMAKCLGFSGLRENKTGLIKNATKNFCEDSVIHWATCKYNDEEYNLDFDIGLLRLKKIIKFLNLTDKLN